jgi:hypothetical protein
MIKETDINDLRKNFKLIDDLNFLSDNFNKLTMHHIDILINLTKEHIIIKDEGMNILLMIKTNENKNIIYDNYTTNYINTLKIRVIDIINNIIKED